MGDPIHDYLSEIGRKGGAAGRGSAKAGDINLIRSIRALIAKVEGKE